ncbi:hypothetical protein UY3_09644 [Chelonia mydas]|uniref:Uncharacterized protein n=1 Tax=Chelonia mydas TaxID=8469 RepID=M7BCA8_CHEMY|nr:hypothetical protein UY3_09644 [Chelonia mydas]
MNGGYWELQSAKPVDAAGTRSQDPVLKLGLKKTNNPPKAPSIVKLVIKMVHYSFAIIAAIKRPIVIFPLLHLLSVTLYNGVDHYGTPVAMAVVQSVSKRQ